MESTAKCPRCGRETRFEIDDYEDRAVDITCEECLAEINVAYSVRVEVGDVELIEVPPVEFDCTECSNTLELFDIGDENGSEEMECDNCNARLDVTWSNWGQSVNVTLIEPGSGKVDEDDDDDEEEDPRRQRYLDDDEYDDKDDGDDFDNEDDDDFDDF